MKPPGRIFSDTASETPDVYCLRGSSKKGRHANSFHLLVRMLPEAEFSDAEIRTRFQRYYGADSDRKLTDGQIPTLRAKWASLSEYVKEIKQGFSRWYNKRHDRKGFFWGGASRACWWTTAIPWSTVWPILISIPQDRARGTARRLPVVLAGLSRADGQQG